MPKGFYTVALEEKGFPVYFKCPNCQKLHSWPEYPASANYQDPGEASQNFKKTFQILANWEYITEANMLLLMVIS